jgi:hypothetical protein
LELLRGCVNQLEVRVLGFFVNCLKRNDLPILCHDPNLVVIDSADTPEDVNHIHVKEHVVDPFANDEIVNRDNVLVGNKVVVVDHGDTDIDLNVFFD